MNVASVPQTAINDRTPSIPQEFRGVVIVASRFTDKGDPVQIDGVFQIPGMDGDEIGHPIHRSLACAIWGNGFQDSVDPFREIVLFSDDEKLMGDVVYGAFSFRVFLHRGSGLYFHVALGEHLSASVPGPP